ncbi:MAG: hypothetical protein WBG86_07695 [Polyangiales bacterium]
MGQQLAVFSTTVALVASLVFHGLVFGYLASRTANFDFDFDLTLPTEVEFGLTDGVTGSPAARTAAGLDAVPESSSLPKGTDDDGTAPDAGVPDDVPDNDADTEAESVAEADGDLDADDPIPVGPSAITGPSRIPPGAQLALRIDIKRIRESPLGPDVTRFLLAVPDWQLLLDGSGIDPVEDLDRLLIASPNLERSKLVLAGRHRRDPSFARERVKRMAKARGRRTSWKRREGVNTARWHNRDETPRTLAILGPQHFTITRARDLPKVLAVMNARELRDVNDEDLIAARGPDALLSMGPDEALSLEIEGVHRFVLGNVKHVPERLRVAVRETGDNQATVTVLATFDSSEGATLASAYWKRVADFYSQQLFVSIAGFGKTLRRLELTPSDERITVSFALNADQIRFILSYLEGRLQTRGRKAPTKKGP